MQTTIIIHVLGPAATAVNFAPAAGPFRVPVAKGTVLGRLTIEPAGWTGNVAVGGADAAAIGVGSDLAVVASADLTLARDYSVTITASE